VVRVDGRVVKEPGRRVEPDSEQVTVRGRPLPGRSMLRYLMLNKPVGVLTTLSDPEGRRTVREFLPPSPRLFPVGRLDADTSGLLLLTNDGELAHRLMHPRYGVRKVYRVRVSQLPTPDQVRRLRDGVPLDPGVRSAPAEVRVLRGREGRAVVEMAVHEGRYHQVRRMCEVVGLEVKALHRSAYGPLRLARMARGEVRDLTRVEVARLRRESARPGGARRPGAVRRPPADVPPPEVEEEDDDRGWSPFRSEREAMRLPEERPPAARRSRDDGLGDGRRASRDARPRRDDPRASREARPRREDARASREARPRRDDPRASRDARPHRDDPRASRAPRSRRDAPRASRAPRSRRDDPRASRAPGSRGRDNPRAARDARPRGWEEARGPGARRPLRSGRPGQSTRAAGGRRARPRPSGGPLRSGRPRTEGPRNRGRRPPNR
jgi:pseudouridine synthase